jgi:hypothetical protein
MIPIAIALFYCKLFSGITSIFLLNHFTIIQILIWEFEYSLYQLVLVLFQLMFSSTLVIPMIIPIHQISSRHHLDPLSYHTYLNLSCLVHIYSNCNCATWVRYEYISIQYSTSAIVVLIQFYYHSIWSCFIMFNEHLSHILKYQSFISTLMPT